MYSYFGYSPILWPSKHMFRNRGLQSGSRRRLPHPLAKVTATSRPSSASSSPCEQSDACSSMEFTDLEIQQIKDHNQKRVKRVVAVVAISMTIIAIVLVGLSLSFGKKIDLLVEESMEKRHQGRELLGLNVSMHNHRN
ncbi:unnamed protein product, partial [Mesorhabditis spiculigera]